MCCDYTFLSMLILCKWCEINEPEPVTCLLHNNNLAEKKMKILLSHTSWTNLGRMWCWSQTEMKCQLCSLFTEETSTSFTYPLMWQQSFFRNFTLHSNEVYNHYLRVCSWRCLKALHPLSQLASHEWCVTIHISLPWVDLAEKSPPHQM